MLPFVPFITLVPMTGHINPHSLAIFDGFEKRIAVPESSKNELSRDMLYGFI